MTTPMARWALVLGHQGGWDELGLALIPLTIFAVLLALATRRATRFQEEEDKPAETVDPPPFDEPAAR